MISNLLITDISEIGEIIYNSTMMNYFTNKIIPINVSSDIPLHKFWVHLDKCKLLSKCENKIYVILPTKSNSIKIINSIEEKISQKLKNDISDLLDIQFSINTTSIPAMLLDVDFQTTAFENDDKKINISNIGSNSDINLIVELDYLMVTPDKIFYNWRVVQVRKASFININESMFSKIHDKPNSNNNSQLYGYIPSPSFLPSVPAFVSPPSVPALSPPSIPALMPPPPLPPGIPNQGQNTHQIKRFAPSISDLSNALGKLKKPLDIKKTNDQNQLLQIIAPVLKHIEIKEPQNITKILKNEFISSIKNDIEKFNNIKKFMNDSLSRKMKLLQELGNSQC